MFWFACVSGWCNKSSPLEIPLKYSLLKQTGKPLSFFRTNCFLCPFLCSPVQQLKMLQWFSCMRAVIVFNSFLFCDFLEMLLLSFQNKTFFFFLWYYLLAAKISVFLALSCAVSHKPEFFSCPVPHRFICFAYFNPPHLLPPACLSCSAMVIQHFCPSFTSFFAIRLSLSKYVSVVMPEDSWYPLCLTSVLLSCFAIPLACF